jgi:beta-N-acetylhexosaminidase
VPARMLLVASLAGLVACTPAPVPQKSSSRPVQGQHSSPASAAPKTTARPAPQGSPRRTAPAAEGVDAVFDRLSPDERLGQLFMIGTPSTSVDPTAVSYVQQGIAGSIILTGRSYAGTPAVKAVTTRFQAAGATANASLPKLYVATDQEGGQVQVLHGPGFDEIPEALQQGRIAPADLRARATGWGRQLAAAGVNLDLGPVLDTVPSAAFARSNPPIGGYDREFGFDPDTVASHGTAVVAGLRTAGISSTVKHFPGLGRVTANTDTDSGVTDSQTTRSDPYLLPFKRAITDRVAFVMMSTAIYSRIDPSGPAAFSPTVVTGLLRQELGFTGLVISDDIGNAAQVQNLSVGQRAVSFLAAGGDVVLTVEPSQLPAMRHSVRERIDTDPHFAAQVTAAVKAVLRAKLAAGLG